MLCGSQQELTQSMIIHVIIVSIIDEFLLLLGKKKFKKNKKKHAIEITRFTQNP